MKINWPHFTMVREIFLQNIETLAREARKKEYVITSWQTGKQVQVIES